ncbi:hypothetical protein HYU93_02435 [Candidatus Daviesbacteria bacterium]|nr:hypothetical protein [Candidatus Daviesbacteria bacterium]
MKRSSEKKVSITRKPGRKKVKINPTTKRIKLNSISTYINTKSLKYGKGENYIFK